MMFSPDVAKKGRVLVVNSSMHIHYLSMLGIYLFKGTNMVHIRLESVFAIKYGTNLPSLVSSMVQIPIICW